MGTIGITHLICIKGLSIHILYTTLLWCAITKVYYLWWSARMAFIAQSKPWRKHSLPLAALWQWQYFVQCTTLHSTVSSQPKTISTNILTIFPSVLVLKRCSLWSRCCLHDPLVRLLSFYISIILVLTWEILFSFAVPLF